jgi:tetratricopeptide (TPR) repeat protein
MRLRLILIAVLFCIAAMRGTKVFADPPATSPSQAFTAPDLYNTANTDMGAGKFDQAFDEFHRAADLFTKSYGSQQNEDVALCLNGQALCLSRLGRDADALPIYRQTLTLCQSIYKNQDNSDTACVMGELAKCLMALQRDDEALPLCQSGLDMQKRLATNADDPDVASAMVTLGDCLCDLDRQSDALPVYTQAWEMKKRLSNGQDDADLASAVNRVGNCLFQLQRYDEALPKYEAALAMRQRICNGADDSIVVVYLGNTAQCLKFLGRESEGLPLYQKALEITRRLTNGQDDPDLAGALCSLGICLYDLGKYDDALKPLQDSLDMTRRLYDKAPDGNQVPIATSMCVVAKCLEALGRSGDALPMYQSALDLLRKASNGQDDDNLADAMSNLGDCLDALGRDDEAMQTLQAAIEMRRRIRKGQDSQDVASSLNSLAVCLGHLGHYQDAFEKCQAALEMLKRLHNGQDSPDVATALANVALCLDDMGRSAEAWPDHESALEMRRRLFNDQDHPDIADSLTNLAGCYAALGRNDDALSTYQQALDMYQRLYKDHDHPSLSMALSNVAVALDNLERFADALPLHQQALDMNRRIFKDQDNPNIAVDYSLLAGSQISVGHSTEALHNAQTALEMYQRIYKGDHPMIAWSLSRVGQCQAELGLRPDALKTYQQADAMAERLNDPLLYQYTGRLGQLLWKSGDAAGAEAAYDKAINQFEQARALIGGTDQDRMKFMDAHELNDFDGYLAMVPIELALHHPDKAIEYLDRGRARVLLDRLDQAEHQSGDDLFSAVKSKAQQVGNFSLLRQINDAAADLTASQDQVARLMAQINYARALNTSEADAQIALLQPQLDQARDQLTAANRRAYTLAGSETFSQTASAQEIQAFLKPHQHLLMYDINDRQAILLVIPPSGQAITAVPLAISNRKSPTIDLVTAIVKYEQAIIQNRQNVTRGVIRVNVATQPSAHVAQDGYDLFQKLMPAEVWNQIKDDDLVFIVPDSMMNGLPLETLITRQPTKPNATDNQYWLDSGPAICYAPSASALLKLCAHTAATSPETYSHEAVLLGDPVFQRDAPSTTSSTANQTRSAGLGEYGVLNPLPGTRTEITGIYEVLTGHAYSDTPDSSVAVLLGEEATEDNLASAVTGTKYLHLATHGLAKSGADAAYSAVVLTQPRSSSSANTGMLTLEDLFDRWGGKLAGTKLVVLSACDSQGIDQGGTNAVTDEGVFGLPWGFWYAGAPAVVASLWEVQDSSTATLMQDFYRNLKSPDCKSQLAAFTAARKELRKQYPEPFYWAPFIYLGDPQ